MPEGEDINSLAASHEDAKGLFNQLFLDRTFLPVQKVETILNIPAVASSVKDTDAAISVTFQAGESVTLMPGFHAKAGTEVSPKSWTQKMNLLID